MSDVIHATFDRLAPVLKARTVLRRRVAEEEKNGSSTNIASVADNLALGWLEDDVRLRRQAVGFLKSAEEGLADVVNLARDLVREHEVANKSALLFFTLLEGVRRDVRESLTRVALCGIAVAFTAAVLTDGASARTWRARLARRKSEDSPVTFEVGGEL